MDDHKEKKQPQSRVKKSSSPFVFLIPLLIISILVGLYLYNKKNPGQSELHSQEMASSVSATNEQNVLLSQKNKPTDFATNPAKQNNDTLSSKRNSSLEVPSQSQSQSSPNFTDKNNNSPVIIDKNQPSVNAQCRPLLKTINDYYAHLDQQPYMQNFHLQESSRKHFSRLIQKLINHPPVVTRETDDLFTLLKNTAHFFRILGKKNIFVLKGILDREKGSLEQILQTFYSLSFYPDCLQKEYSLTLPPDALYDYAGFFLNTMGGRLYLFRRDSTSRMIVTYFAILIIDRANIEGDDRHGIDLIPAINSLIEEIENGGKLLQHREDYLDRLYDLKEKYSR